MKFSRIKNPITANMGKILYSRAILYIVFAICLFQLFMLTSTKDYFSCAVFVLVSFLTSFFSKNMLVILVIALVVTNILKYGTNVRQEGFVQQEGFDQQDEFDTKDMDDSLDLDNSPSLDLSNTDELDINSSDIPLELVKGSAGSSATKTKTTTAPPNISDSQLQRLKGMMSQYNELMSTQSQITEHMTALNDGLTTAENLISQISEHMKNKSD